MDNAHQIVQRTACWVLIDWVGHQPYKSNCKLGQHPHADAVGIDNDPLGWVTWILEMAGASVESVVSEGVASEPLIVRAGEGVHAKDPNTCIDGEA